jgi:hypothetical protein
VRSTRSIGANAGAVYRYAMAMAGDAAAAADATHDAFVALATRPAGFDAARRELGAYLTGIARHSLLVAHRLPGLLPRGPGVLSPLGSKEIEGVRVDGERTTWTIEAGRMGNEEPIVITRDVWTSPELLLTVQSREFDPRSGETTYRLGKLRRGEPDPALMKVPADYDASRGGARPAPPAASSSRG